MSDPLRDRIERYYATVPLLFADAEDFGPLRLFVRKEPGAPYYGGPSHAQPTGAASVGAADIARVRARQRELGVPEAFEWLAESAPALRARIEAAGLLVLRRPLMVLPPHHPLPPQPLPDGVTLRALTADDPALPAALALPRLAFAKEPLGKEPLAAEPSPAAGPSDRAELSRLAEALTGDGTVAAVRPTIRAGHKTLVAALAPDGTPLATGHYHPANAATEIGGVGTLPSARRQGLAAAVTAALVAHARAQGVETIFLAYAEETVARIYARLGFRPAGTTLLIADQPARS
ncbi:GNAT family N-acetyltransferase [Streptomyces asoensis]|uniref:GNAT family N-acetyltransferase n=1 Tax=Streptomyces asoensis TaxID=249586 RepID=A0A6M4WQV4_9ACTN|nr:GNAT family N-acetyltransferase [Streptomyces asoensis]QJT02101.1 GNAT family N-acetyltransferase [Streptomyces asoensis]